MPLLEDGASRWKIAHKGHALYADTYTGVLLAACEELERNHNQESLS